jgi:single-strand DNA-binding protein
MSLNKVTLIGRVGQDPDIRNTNDGRAIANLSIATSDTWNDKNSGEKREKTEWHRVVIFSQGLVGIVQNYVKKGSLLYIEGALQTRKWTDSSGVEKYTTEVVLQNYNSTLQMLGGKSQGDSQNQYQEPQTQSTSQSEPAAEDCDDDIPF